jgi:hypothetical protein
MRLNDQRSVFASIISGDELSLFSMQFDIRDNSSSDNIKQVYSMPLSIIGKMHHSPIDEVHLLCSLSIAKEIYGVGSKVLLIEVIGHLP